MGSVNATLVTLATTVTALQRRRPAFQTTGRCAADEAAVCAAAVSVLSRGLLEIPVKNAPPAPMPVVLKGKVCCRSTPHCNEHFTPLIDRMGLLYEREGGKLKQGVAICPQESVMRRSQTTGQTTKHMGVQNESQNPHITHSLMVLSKL